MVTKNPSNLVSRTLEQVRLHSVTSRGLILALPGICCPDISLRHLKDGTTLSPIHSSVTEKTPVLRALLRSDVQPTGTTCTFQRMLSDQHLHAFRF